MGLCNLYQRHCVVLTQNKLWSTIQADAPMNLLDLLKECSIRLIYLGNQRFGVLTWRPRLPKKVASKSPGFNIVEEYTLDEVIDKQATNTSKVSSEAAGNVVTSGGDGNVASVHQTVNNYPVKETVEIKPKAREPSGAKPLHVVMETEVRSAPTTEVEQTTLTTPPTDCVFYSYFLTLWKIEAFSLCMFLLLPNLREVPHGTKGTGPRFITRPAYLRS